MKLTALIENESPREDLFAEHGLSLLIEADGRRYLMDTGASDAFLPNARTLGFDLRGLDGVILSHNHNDHTGGIRQMAEHDPQVRFFFKNAAHNRPYQVSEEPRIYPGEQVGLRERYIGEPEGFFFPHGGPDHLGGGILPALQPAVPLLRCRNRPPFFL